MTASNPLHFIVSVDNSPTDYGYVKITRKEMEDIVNNPISVDAWQDLDISLSHIFGRYADFIDIGESMFLQKDDVTEENSLKNETLQFLKNVYGEINHFSASVALTAGV